MLNENDERHPREDAPRRPTRPRPSLGHPWFTRVVIAVCIGIHISIRAEENPELYSTLAPYGIVPLSKIYAGAVWGLVTPTVLHYDVLHLAFNLYWLWVIGQAMECAIGTLRFVAFYVLAAAVGTCGQILVSGPTGIGASGVVYAIFGYMWITRRRYAEFAEILTPRIVQFMMVWLFLCIPLTWLDILPIANGGHFGGMAFGLAVGAAVVRLDRLREA